LVLVAGALGAYIHAATSFGSHLGAGDFSTSWLWWYVLRPLVGASLAGLLYLAVRGGLVSVSTGEADVNPYGMAALAGLAGLFSTPLTARLATIFDAILGKTGEDGPAARPPRIGDLDPSTAPVGNEVEITVTGEDFVESSKVAVDGREVETTFSNSTTLHATIPNDVLGQVGVRKITVITPDQEDTEPRDLTVQ
jgi:hypothetical protein